MKKYTQALSFLVIIALVYWSFYALYPQKSTSFTIPNSSFMLDNALAHVKNMAQKPHYVGADAHSEVRDYLVNELKKLGLNPTLQEGFTGGDWGNVSKAINIIARKKGTGNGKALLLLSHYDSRAHASLGASDAASGVATILEGLRAFIADNTTHKNDIIVVFTDAEELGLNGAQVFVNNHPWINDVGLVLNFEARGSGGPSYMLIETNQGNAKLIEAFNNANVPYPVANSLAYSIYKMLPNDTDLTIFREDGNINGFNFAFIDDHFDYHTALDKYERLDHTSLAHQATYLMPALNHFSNANLTELSATTDYVYFNVPAFKLVSYPYSFIWPMLLLGLLVFVVLIGYGLKKSVLSVSDIAKSFIPFFITLIVAGLIGFFAWNVLLLIYPQYHDILQGFPYNGHYYIAAFVALTLAVCFFAYHKFNKLSAQASMVAPITIWLFLCTAIAVYLKGASFFIIPVYGALAVLWILLNDKKPNLLVLVVLSVPALWIFPPFIQMFPVGLGLKMMIAATLLTTLLFGLLVGIFSFYNIKKQLSGLAFAITLLLLLIAHFKATPTVNTPKPNSLLYVLDADNQKAYWATYDRVIDDWTGNYIPDSIKENALQKTTLTSKYGTGFTKTAPAPVKSIQEPYIEIIKDTTVGNNRLLQFCITPQRDVNRLELFINNEVEVLSAKVNGVVFSPKYIDRINTTKRIFTHHISDNAYTEVTLAVSPNTPVNITLFEASYNLLSHPQFSIPERPENTTPMPFVLNDAIAIQKTLLFN